jgi:hypothetical protein
VAKQIVADSLWSDRLKTADLYYKEWETLFKCKILDKYYEGLQWRSQKELGYNPYVINKIYETIQIKIANFIPTFPVFNVASRVGNEDDIKAAATSAQLKEDLLNTITQDPDNNFAFETEQAYKDHFFRFGMVEVGYAADWILNPNAQRPLLGKDTDTKLSSKEARKVVEAPPELPINERIYFKHISAKTFRIGGTDHKYLNRCGWCGYFEYVHKDDLLSIKNLLNKDKIQSATGSNPDPNRESVPIDSERFARNTLKIWHLWDNRSMKRLIVLDSPCVTVFERKFKRLPLFDLRPDIRLITGGFYPIPPAYHWLSPQDEYNEIREMLRAHRRRFVRKFGIVEGMMDDEEIEKFETGPDGALVKMRQQDAIKPIENADLGQALNESIATSTDDLNRISGTSDEARGVADRTTATQANIVQSRTNIRESKERDRVVKWMAGMGREVLLTINEKFTGKILAKLTQAEGETFMSSVNIHKPLFREITSEDLKDGFDFKIEVDVTSMSSMAQLQEKQKLMEYVSFLTQFPMVAFSPYLVREAAYRIGYRNEKAIAEFQQMALLMELARMGQLKQQAQQAQGPPPPPNGGAPEQIMQAKTPPDQEQIRNQLQNQMGQTAVQ